MYIQLKHFRLYPAAILITSMIGSLASPVYAAAVEAFEQSFLVTAYYSPLPNQSAYFRGDYSREIEFNGQGIQGADGTAVYPGMIAAPMSYEYGTRISLPSIDMTGTVHDRGGRIIEWTEKDNGVSLHRIDIWMGHGEEGLARALNWGARTMMGMVFPNGSDQPAEQWSLAAFDAPLTILGALTKTAAPTAITNIAVGEKSQGIKILQQTLKDLGYFSHAITDTFGPKTQEALQSFQSDFGIQGDSSKIDPQTLLTLTVAQEKKKSTGPSISVGLQRGMRGGEVKEAQRMLRYLGYYKGRTDGVYDKTLIDAVVAFQMEHKLIGSNTTPGAGRIGPVTTKALLKEWKIKQVKQQTVVAKLKLDIAEKIREEQLPKSFLTRGDTGNDVRSLQTMLAQLGYFDVQDVTSNFGEKTRAALVAYQKERKIIASEKDLGAGNFGPATKAALEKDVVNVAWKQVRAEGVKAL